MNDPFSIIEAFLRRGEPEVIGHEVEVPAETLASFSRLARGELDRAAIRELSEVLRDHPDWVHRLAEEIRHAGSR